MLVNGLKCAKTICGPLEQSKLQSHFLGISFLVVPKFKKNNKFDPDERTQTLITHYRKLLLILSDTDTCPHLLCVHTLDLSLTITVDI